jgi:hypothetical protein
MTYMRCVIALFMNCIKHGDPTGICTVKLEPEPGDFPTLRTTITNDDWPGMAIVGQRLEVRWRQNPAGTPPGVSAKHIAEKLREGSNSMSSMVEFSTGNVLDTLITPRRHENPVWAWSGDLKLPADELRNRGNKKFQVQLLSPDPRSPDIT